jgi:hypothetical protein
MNKASNTKPERPKAAKIAPSGSRLQSYVSRCKPLGHVPLRTADAARSLRNIALWNSYLPPDCVRTMVRMGWDYTT